MDDSENFVEENIDFGVKIIQNTKKIEKVDFRLGVSAVQLPID